MVRVRRIVDGKYHYIASAYGDGGAVSLDAESDDKARVEALKLAKEYFPNESFVLYVCLKPDGSLFDREIIDAYRNGVYKGEF